jgi:hypothetical protein
MVTYDSIPANRTFKGIRLFLHDITAPFFMYLSANYEVKMEMKQADGSERLIIEDLGEYTPLSEVSEGHELPEELKNKQLTEEQEKELLENEYMELLTAPDSLDAGSKLIQ